MHRLVVATRLLLGLVVCALLGEVLTAVAAPSPARVSAMRLDPRPNILLISTDDQTVEELRWMPKTRALLAEQGVMFDGLSPHPLCCPARAEILTGQYAQNNGVYSNSGATGGYPALRDPDNTIAAWLQRAGYRTGFSGKFLNGYSWRKHGRPAGWDFWDPTVLGTYAYVGYVSVNDGDRRKAPPGEYIADYVSRVTTSHLLEWAQDDRPFFFWASHVAPHTSCAEGQEAHPHPPLVAPAYADAYPDARNPAASKPSFNEPDVSDKPPHLRTPPVSARKLQRLFLQRIRSLASVDQAVSDAVSALETAGELDNTVIIFTSDNGYLMGEHRQRAKKKPYEESLRVPLIVRGPGFGAGERAALPGSIVDLAPTITSLAQAEADRVQDGVSLQSLLETPAPADATRLIQSGLDVEGNRLKLWDWQGVRDQRYTWVRWSSGFIELYDRLLDPYQLHNRARDPRYREIAMLLERRFLEVRDCAGSAQCYREFGPLPAPKGR